MRKLLYSLLGFALLVPTVLQAAEPAKDTSVTITFSFVGPPSTAINCTLTAASFQVPVAAGTVLANCTVAPANWQGVFAVSGATGIVSAGSGVNYTIQVGGTPYTTVGSVTETVSATP